MQASRLSINNIRTLASYSKGRRQVAIEKVVQKDYVQLLNAFANGFGAHEPTIATLALQYADVCNIGTYIVSNAIRSGHSIKLVDKERNNEIVGFRCVSSHSVHPDENITSAVTLDIQNASEKLRKLMIVLDKCRESILNHGKAADWKRWLIADAIYIDPEYKNNGQKLSKIVLTKDLTPDVLLAKGIDGYAGECTSAKSLKVFTNYGFKALEPVSESAYEELGLPRGFRVTPAVFDAKDWQRTRTENA